MSRLVVITVMVAAVGAAAPSPAADGARLSGTWEWIVHRDGKAGVATVDLRLDGDRVTGVMHGRTDMIVENGTFKSGQVSFEVPAVNPDGSHMVHRYRGKLTDDLITGTSEIEVFGRTKKSGKWLAQRYGD